MLLFLSPFNFDFTIDLKVILALFGLLVAILVATYFQWWRNRKRFSHEILSSVPLISAREAIADKIQIIFEGKAVKNVHLLVIKLVNDGYQPLLKEDFQQEVRIFFPSATILGAEKIEFNPDNLESAITHREEFVAVQPTLFNRKDFVKFKVFLSNYNERPNFNARIVGITSITKTGNSPKSFVMAVGVAMGLMISIVGLGLSDRVVMAILIVLAVALILMFGLAWFFKPSLLFEKDYADRPPTK